MNQITIHNAEGVLERQIRQAQDAVRQRQEHANWGVVATVEKYRPGDKKPYEVVISPNNGLLNEGIALMWDLITGTAGTAYTNANSRLGVGNGSAVFAASQTGLQGASGTYVGMAAGYPLRANQTVDFKGTFGTGLAEFSWEEWTVDQGSTGTLNMNRKVGNLGTKGTSEIWVLTVSITIS